MINSTKENTTSSTAQDNAFDLDSASITPKFSSGTSSKEPSVQETLQQLVNCLSPNNQLEERIKKIEENQKKQDTLFASITKLNNISSGAITFLMLVPLLQLFLCVLVVYGLGVEDKLPALLKWFLSGISIASLVEVVYSFFGINSLKKRIDDIENNLKGGK